MTTIRCKFRQSILGYQCYITIQLISSTSIKLQGNHHEAGKTNDDVENLYFHDCTFNGFPINLHILFPNLTGITIQKSRLNQGLLREHLTEFKENLVTIYVTHSDLKKLNGDLFKDFKKLEKVSFANNKLEEIGAEILDGLWFLNIVDFRGNTNIDIWYNSNNDNSSLLEEVKNAIKSKCKRKPKQHFVQQQQQVKMPQQHLRMPQQPPILVMQPQMQPVMMKNPWSNAEKILLRENEKLTIENSNLRAAIKNQEEFIKKLQEENKNLMKQLERQPRHENPILYYKKNASLNPNFKDLTINIGESSFKVHKNLFAAQSKTLAEHFKNNPDLEVLKLKDIPEITFKAVYDFIYKNQLPEDANYIDVYKAAARLKIDNLLKITTAKLIDSIDKNNACDILILGNKSNNEQLRQKALEAIQLKIFSDQKLEVDLSKQEEMLEQYGAAGVDNNKM
ncbi:hypothetical protein PVAND_015540 [Polypedilum vanderplanki]|uniref:BTB domain-containing protein n=1 Tax=Polypedilum vanderplanki TaxID=319348 RepID=A0A9J6BDF7_POLVA|nr:hypothetical protein PVAND_015540 [Polypedilum vanderplanki]